MVKIVKVQYPKSELTLDNEELDNLVTWINQHYYPLVNNESKYLSFNDEIMSLLIKKPESISGCFLVFSLFNNYHKKRLLNK